MSYPAIVPQFARISHGRRTKKAPVGEGPFFGKEVRACGRRVGPPAGPKCRSVPAGPSASLAIRPRVLHSKTRREVSRRLTDRYLGDVSRKRNSSEEPERGPADTGRFYRPVSGLALSSSSAAGASLSVSASAVSSSVSSSSNSYQILSMSPISRPFTS